MKNTKLSISLATLLVGMVGCASGPQPPRATATDVSASFRACSAESKLPWLVHLVAQDAGNKKPLTTLVSEFVGGTSADQTRALTYLNDLRLQKYASGEHMAASHFNTCLAQKSTPPLAPERALSCYKEQRLIFALEGLRFDQQATQAQATQHLVQANPSADGSTERVIERLAGDVYTILKPGGESAFGEAQFRVCMTTP